MTNGALDKPVISEPKFVGGAFTPERKKQIEEFLEKKGRRLKPGEKIPLKPKKEPKVEKIIIEEPIIPKAPRPEPPAPPVKEVVKTPKGLEPPTEKPVTPIADLPPVKIEDLPSFVERPVTTPVVSQETIEFVPKVEAERIRVERKRQQIRELGGETLQTIESGIREAAGIPEGKTVIEQTAEQFKRGDVIGAFETTKRRLQTEAFIGAALAIPSIPLAITQIVTEPVTTAQIFVSEVARDPFATTAQLAGASVVFGGIEAGLSRLTVPARVTPKVKVPTAPTQVFGDVAVRNFLRGIEQEKQIVTREFAGARLVSQAEKTRLKGLRKEAARQIKFQRGITELGKGVPDEFGITAGLRALRKFRPGVREPLPDVVRFVGERGISPREEIKLGKLAAQAEKIVSRRVRKEAVAELRKPTIKEFELGIRELAELPKKEIPVKDITKITPVTEPKFVQLKDIIKEPKFVGKEVETKAAQKLLIKPKEKVKVKPKLEEEQRVTGIVRVLQEQKVLTEAAQKLRAGQLLRQKIKAQEVLKTQRIIKPIVLPRISEEQKFVIKPKLLTEQKLEQAVAVKEELKPVLAPATLVSPALADAQRQVFAVAEKVESKLKEEQKELARLRPLLTIRKVLRARERKPEDLRKPKRVKRLRTEAELLRRRGRFVPKKAGLPDIVLGGTIGKTAKAAGFFKIRTKGKVRL